MNAGGHQIGSRACGSGGEPFAYAWQQQFVMCKFKAALAILFVQSCSSYVTRGTRRWPSGCHDVDVDS